MKNDLNYWCESTEKGYWTSTITNEKRGCAPRTEAKPKPKKIKRFQLTVQFHKKIIITIYTIISEKKRN